MRKWCYFVLCVGSVLWAVGCGNEKLQHVDVYFTADALGFYASRPEPRLNNREVGGYAILKNFVQGLQEPYLLFDGGNWFGAAAEGPFTKGSFISSFLKQIPYTAATLSPADFNYGWTALRQIVRQLPFPFVAANLRLENSIPWPLHDYQIRTIEGIKIGIFGLVEMPQSHGKDVRFPGLSVLDPVQTAQEMAAMLKEKKVDYIIVLSSLGVLQTEKINNTLLAQEVDGLGLILISNQDREQAETETIKDTLLVYPGARLDSVAHIRVFFDRNKRAVDTSFEDILLDKGRYSEDTALAEQAARLRKETEEKMNQRVSFAQEEIPTYTDRESPLGKILAECLHKWAKLDGVVLNAASIRNALPQGVVKEHDVYKMYPYGDNITFLTLKGKVLLRALQMSLNTEGNFPQVAGMTVRYRILGNDKLIQEVVLKNGRLVRPNDTYRIAVTDHILAGGFGHDEFINALEFKNTFVEARQIMRSCLVRQKQIAVPDGARFEEIK